MTDPGSMCLKSSLVWESLRWLGRTTTLLVSSVSVLEVSDDVN